MRRRARLLSRLDLRPGEGRVVLGLAALSLCLGWATVLADTASMALFLSALGAPALPTFYLAAAAVVPLAGAALSWATQQLPTDRLAAGALALLLAALLLIWGAGALGPWAFFALLLWYRVANPLTGVLFWGLAGRALDLRQAKRLYGLASSGENVARVVGYAAVPLLVGAVGVTGLLGVAGLGLIGALAAVAALRRAVPAARFSPARAPGAPSPPARAALASRYTLTLLAIIALGNWAFSSFDLLFAGQMHRRFGDPRELASFLAGLSLVLSVVRLVGRPLLTGRAIGRLGVAASSLVQPAALFVGAAALLALPAGGADMAFWWVVGMRFVDTVTSALLSRPALQILFQPLPANQRLAVQSVAEGVVAPLALGVAGLTGLAAGGASPAALVGALAGIALAWALVTSRVGSAYLAALGRRLSRRIGRGGGADLSDPAAAELVRRALGSPRGGEVLYAIELLRDRHPAALEEALGRLLASPDPAVRRAALELVGEGRVAADPGVLTGIAAGDPDPPTRAAAVRALCAALEVEAIELVAPLADDPSAEVSRSAMAGLLRHAGVAGVLAAGPRLLAMAESPSAGERALAAQVIGDLRSIDYIHPLRRLLADPDPAVRRVALLAAGEVGHARLLPLQIAALADRSTAAAAAAGLERTGPQAGPALAEALAAAPPAAQVQVAAALGRVGGEAASAALAGLVDSADPELRSAACAGLAAGAYRAYGPQRRRVEAQIMREASEAAWLLAAVSDLDPAADGTLLEALMGDAVGCRERILHLLATVGDAQSVATARANLAQPAADRRAYAVEMIDVLVPAPLKAAVVPLFDDAAPATLAQRLRAASPQPALGRAERLRQIACDPAAPVGHWSRRCARAAAGQGEAGEREAVARVAALRRTQLFAETPGAILEDVAGRLAELSVPAGRTVFERGGGGDWLFILVSGAVRIHADGQTLNVLRAGDVFGEMAALDAAPRSASAEAAEDCELLRLGRGDLEALFEERPEVMRTLIRTLTRNLRRNVAILAELRARNAERGTV